MRHRLLCDTGVEVDRIVQVAGRRSGQIQADRCSVGQLRFGFRFCSQNSAGTPEYRGGIADRVAVGLPAKDTTTYMSPRYDRGINFPALRQRPVS